MMTSRVQEKEHSQVSIDAEEARPGVLLLKVSGRLDATTTGGTWRYAMLAIGRSSPEHVVVEAAGVQYCDISGIGFFMEIGRRQRLRNGTVEIKGLRTEFRQLLDLFDPEKIETKRPESRVNVTERLGASANGAWQDIEGLIAFLGELCDALVVAAKHPRSVRWKDGLRAAEKHGVDALPIVALVSFLVGLIMAFQSAIPMRQFGAQIYVANLVALSMLRELGPLMTAIILAGRTGSAFAAELGTMKVREEIDALITMGLEPVRFLVVTRLIAGLFMTPLLTVFADLLGMVGGGVVILSLGFSLETYYYQIVGAVTYIDFLGGLAKSFAFGLIVAGIGCARGLQTGVGAAAVGESTTKAVVTGIILIIVADGTFAVVYYYLGI
jgi:phospholipid/cholesterol/gamma-HCH transport system permease protein